MSKRLRTILAGVTIPMGLGAGLWLRHARPWESATDRAYRLCGLCGHTAGEVDTLIDNSRHAKLTREELVKLWEQTYSDSGTLNRARELCGPFVDAVLAVGIEAHED